MLSQIDEFVKWVRRRNAEARTWRDYSYDLQVAVQGAVGSRMEIPLSLDTRTSHAYPPAISRGTGYNLGFSSQPAGGHGQI